MSIEPHPGKKPLVPPPPLPWGEVVPVGETALALRFALGDRVVTYPCSEFKRWEHVNGTPETLLLATDKQEIVIEGSDLTAIRAALDLGRLAEVRLTFSRQPTRPGPRIERITIEPA
jgi:hypothetical protein